MMNSTVSRLTRRILLTSACATVLAVPVLAQEPANAPSPQQQGPGRPGGDMQARQLDHMTKALNLTPDQVTQVKAIQADSRQQLMAIRQDTTVAGADKRTKMLSLRDAEQTKIKAVLTDDQKAKYADMQAKMQERREQHRDENGGNTPPPPPPPPSV